MLVFDIATGKVVRRIEGIGRPHAILYLPETDRLCVTDGEDGSVRVFDGDNYEPVARIALLKDADSIGFDASRRLLYVDLHRPQLEQLASSVREGDTVVCYAINRLAQNLDDLRKEVFGCTERCVHVRFQKENLTSTGEDSRCRLAGV